MKAPDDYKPVGKMEDIGDGLQAYVVGESEDGKGVLLIPDIFGIGMPFFCVFICMIKLFGNLFRFWKNKRNCW
jgi:hypothetical protein